MIKLYGNNTKFIFTCNDSSKIIEDIQSVCRILRFKKITDAQINTCLKRICKIENIEYNKSGLDIICYISNGDMRKAINNLQLAAFSFKKITKQNVLNVCKMPDPEEIRKIINLCLNLELENATNEVNLIISQGYYYLDIVTGFIYILDDLKLSYKLKLIEIVNKTKITISTGLRSTLQLTAMICRLIRKISLENEKKID